MTKAQENLPDICYPLRHQSNHEELRYSLRSLKNLPHNNVFVAGDIPEWTTLIHQCPKKQLSDGRKDVFANLQLMLDNPGLKENILVFMDDIFVLKPISQVEPTHGKQVSLSVWKGVSGPTMRVLKKLGNWSAYSYEQHRPFVCEKSKLKYILDFILEEEEDYGHVYWRTVYANYYKIGGELYPDVKVRRNPVLTKEQIFVSSEDTTFDQHLKRLLEPMFPNKSIYEK